MGTAIMIVMIAVAGLTMILFKASPEATLKGTIMRSGLTAIISILGVSWLGSSFFEGNRIYIVAQISDLVQALSDRVRRGDVPAFDVAIQPGGDGRRCLCQWAWRWVFRCLC